jgi:sugar lactone lactonase YvrE
LYIKKKSSLVCLGSLRPYKNLQMKQQNNSKFSSIKSGLERLIFFLILCSVSLLVAQTAPNISYATPQNYEINKLITPLTPSNTGSAIPTFTYGEVNTFSGSVTATFNKPMGLAFDTSDNLIVADATSNKIKGIASNGTVSTIAGSGIASYNLSSALITNPLLANFNAPSGVAVDATGTIFVTDQGSSQIRKIGTDGKVTLFAGKDWVYSLFSWYPQPGFADNIIGTAAAFNKPEGLTIDSNGNLYVADTYNHRIRKITSGGAVTTIAGDGYADLFGGGRFLDGNGTSASFNYPTGVALDPTEKYLYVADKVNQRIRKVLLVAPYTITTLAGSGTISSSDGITTAATFNNPEHLAVDGAGNLFVTEQGGNKIRKITLDGIVTTIAGNGSAGTTDGIGTAANFNGVTGIAISKTGVAYVTDSNANKVRKISLGGYVISPALPTGLTFNGTSGIISGIPTTVTGSINYTVFGINYYGVSNATVAITTAYLPANISYSTPQNFTVNTLITPLNSINTGGSIPNMLYGSELTFSASGFNTPYGVAVDALGNIYVADTYNQKISKINTAGVITTLAGSGSIGATDNMGTAASFNFPKSIAVDVYGNVYVADTNNNKIRKITAAGVVTTFAGSSSFGSSDGTGAAASFKLPEGLTIDSNGNLYVADTGNNKIRKITAAGVVTTLAGAGSYGSTDGAGAAASFFAPTGVAIDVSGNVYVADFGSRKIRKITAGGVVSTIAGSGSYGSTDGAGAAASISGPRYIAVDASGNLFVTDYVNNKIRKITATGIVTTLAGTTGSTRFFNSIAGLAIDSSGILYVADTGNNKIRKVSSIGYAVSPDLPLGLTLDGTGTITGIPTVLSTATDYTVTAYNVGGSSSYTLNFAITGALGLAQETFSKTVVAYPNPFSDTFKIGLSANNSNPIAIAIYDMLGKEIENYKVTPAQIIDLQYGTTFDYGVYNVIVTQGTEVKILRVIKK